MKKILMIEDDIGLVNVVGDRLRAKGYDFEFLTDGQSGMNKVCRDLFDLILLDLRLPVVSGYDVLREARSRGIHTPVIIVSAKFQLEDKIKGLNLGADDYLVKPFESNELIARIEAQLRRMEYNEEDGPENHKEDWLDTNHPDIKNGNMTLNFHKCQLYHLDEPILLSHIEFRLLAYLMLNMNRVVRSEELIEEVWNYHEPVSLRTLYVHIAWLRKKLNNYKDFVKHIKTVRGTGYLYYD